MRTLLLLLGLTACDRTAPDPAAPALRCADVRVDTLPLWIDSVRYLELLRRCGVRS